MNFVKFRDKLIDHFNEITRDAKCLFMVNLDKDELWETYLDSFPKGTNEIFRERREHDCSCCRSFIKAMGNVVVIKNQEIHTIWGFNADSATYQPVVDSLDRYVKSHPVSDVWFSKEKSVGCKENHEHDGDSILTWTHFYIPDIPVRFRTNRSLGDIQNTYRTRKEIFKRSLDEISLDATDTLLELIAQNSLYRGEEWKNILSEFRRYQKEYAKVLGEKKELLAWEKSVEAGDVIGRMRNHSIGVLLADISTGCDLEQSVRRYENIVAPANYKRPKAIFTKKMLEDAKKTITELGYLDSLGRRFATLDDITVNDILFCNKDSVKRISGGMDLFAEMEKDVKVNPKKFDRVEEIGIEKFVSSVLPETQELEVYLENKHQSNLVSLIAPTNKDAKPMFKWGNNFSWAYSGNVADSMKERVKAAGGKVDGVLRFSIQWNDIPGDYDPNDLDAHCIQPNGYRIYFSDKHDRYTGGELDVDIINPVRNAPAVENITWPDLRKMPEGKYEFFVHQYSYRGGNNGFRAEIEFDGKVYSYDYPNKVVGDVKVATVTLKNGKFSIDHKLRENMVSKELWGLTTYTFIPVSVVMFSPNYWDAVENKTGNKHYFFMLKDCINENNPNGFFNEYLKQELVQHKRVFEALGSKAKAEDCADQLSGLGFSSTQRNELIVKVKGATERVLKVKF
jgi:hypothetical protein